MNDQQRAAMRCALEALEEAHTVIEHRQDVRKREEAITALREALAQAQGEWVDLTDDEKYDLNEEYHNSDGKPIKRGYDDAVIAKFKSKNTPPVVPQGEPVALLQLAEDALVYHTEQTRPIQNTIDALAAIQKFKEKQR